jgi:hypothetical protein
VDALAVLDHAALRAAVTPDVGVRVDRHALAAPVAAAAGSAAGTTQALADALDAQLAFYEERIVIVPARPAGDPGLLEIRAEVHWRTPVDPAPRRLVVRALVARPDLSEALPRS